MTPVVKAVMSIKYEKTMTPVVRAMMGILVTSVADKISLFPATVTIIVEETSISADSLASM